MNEIKVDVRIMACRERKHLVDDMLKKLNMNEDIVIWADEEDNNAMKTARKTWLSHVGNGVTHRLVLQDDLLLCNGFYDYVVRIASKHPNEIINLYNSRIQFEDRKLDTPYIRINGYGIYGQAIMMRVDYIKKMFEQIDSVLGKNYPHDDCAIGVFAGLNKIDVISTIPSLVQHLCPTESLLKFNDRRKISKVWTDEDIEKSLLNLESYLINESKYIPNNLYLKDKEKEKLINMMIRKKVKDKS